METRFKEIEREFLKKQLELKKDVLDIEMKIHNMLALQPANLSEIASFKNDEASFNKGNHSERKSGEAATKMSLSELGFSFHMSDRACEMMEPKHESVLSSRPMQSMKSNN